MKRIAVPGAVAWGSARAIAWKNEQHRRIAAPGWASSEAELTFDSRLIDGLGDDTHGTLLIRQWLHGKQFLPDGFECDGKWYGHAKSFSTTLEVQLGSLLFFFFGFRPIEGWEALTRDERFSHLKLLEKTARDFAAALAAPCTPPLPSLLEYIPDEDGERLLRGAFRQVDRDIEHTMGATEIQRSDGVSRYPVARASLSDEGLASDEISGVADEDIYVAYVRDFVQEMDAYLAEKKVPTRARARMASELFDSDLFSEEEGEPFDFGAKFASYLRAFADNVGNRVNLKVRSARPNTNATARQLAIELRKHLEHSYGEGEYSVGVIAALSTIWFTARQADAAPITGPMVTEFLRAPRA